MKKALTKIGALLLAMVIFAAPVGVCAQTSYTYTYDYWEEYQECPDAYTVCKVITSSDLGLEKKMRSPQGITVANNKVYICDTGNNRILVLNRVSKEDFEVIQEIDTIGGNVEVNTLSGPTDLAVSEDGNIFICDPGNQRILKLDPEFNYIMSFYKPVDSTVDPALTFVPTKLVVDTAERVYTIATGINQGVIKYESDGTFSGFIGATPVTYDFWDYIYKKFATQAQRERMVNFVPTEYSNIYADKDGFNYVTIDSMKEEDLDNGSISAVRKLNLLGGDILVQNGNFPVYGDLYWGNGGGHSGCSRFGDITVFDNDVYVCLDHTRGRMFAYDDQGRLMFAWGGNGNMNGYFRNPVGIEHLGYDLLVIDNLDCSITLFIPTDFGKNIFDAIDLFDEGEYDQAGEKWQSVMNEDGNYELAYIGIGRSLLRQKQYKEAMKYFKAKYDDENYSKAFKQYRKIWVQENIGYIFIIILALFLIPFGIGRVRKVKHEIDTADIFQR